MIVCGGEPDPRRIEAFRATRIPMYYTGHGLERSSGSLARRIFKVEPHEEHKIRRIVELVAQYVDTGSILSSLSGETTGEEPKKRGRSEVLQKAFRQVAQLPLLVPGHSRKYIL